MPFKSREEAQEAARKSWEKRRARKEQMRQVSDLGASTTASTDASGRDGSVAPGRSASSGAVSSATDAADIAIIRELERKAQAGDVAAARELREWRRRDPTQDADADALAIAAIVVRMSRDQRAQLRAWLLAHRDSPANGGIREGTLPVFDAPPRESSSRAATPAADEPLARCPSGWPHEELEEAPNNAGLPPDPPAPCSGGPSEYGSLTVPPEGRQADGFGSHLPDGTGGLSQMTVDDCIEVAQREEA